MVFPLRSSIRILGRTPIVVLLILMNTLVFFYQLTLPQPVLQAFITQWGIVPDVPRLTPLLTAMFLHGGWFHLIGNMWILWVFGRNVEDTAGSGRFLAFYLACGLVASIAHTMINPYSRVPMVGASGAIAGVMGAFLLLYPRAYIDTIVFLLFIFRLAVPAPFFLIYWFILQLFNGFGSLTEINYAGGGTAWFAHVGGFIAGMVLIKLLGRRKRRENWLVT